MSDDADDAQTNRTHAPGRTTIGGRSFGNISYAAEESARSDDLRRSASLAVTVEAPASCISVERRDTGARKRASSA